ncbi:hypothetical protein [Amycolatopsis anabasis]|uniref:hypothetical protein n=1 Tax=Amycolatopsis anabasis TaxID=1840409 RepID=UPI00131E7F23|nr:hypothetical protein [Amycolatopsis anabasis]
MNEQNKFNARGLVRKAAALAVLACSVVVGTATASATPAEHLSDRPAMAEATGPDGVRITGAQLGNRELGVSPDGVRITGVQPGNREL